MKIIDDICVFVKKENISRNALIASMIFNSFLSILEITFFSSVVSSNPKYIGSYYVLINITFTLATVFIRFLFEQAYEHKERVMRRKAKEAKALDDQTKDIQNSIILADSHKDITDYYKEFVNRS